MVSHNVKLAREYEAYYELFADLPAVCQRELAYDFPKGRTLPDELVYRNLRNTHVGVRHQEYWLGVLPLPKRKNYNQLRAGANSRLIDRLDALLQFRGLWPDFRFSPFHRMLPERCVPICLQFSLYHRLQDTHSG